jgi:nitrite reductase/ring-hydroxylating ferredoxin subunit
MIEIAKKGDLLPGGMMAVKVGDRELCLCNVNGEFYLIDRRCGHMNAPLNMGTLDGYILTCGMHSVEFDVRTGEPLCPTVPHYSSTMSQPPSTVDNFGNWLGALMEHVTICNVKTYKAVLQGDSVMVDL